jgi:hypothetical protein
MADIKIVEPITGKSVDLNSEVLLAYLRSYLTEQGGPRNLEACCQAVDLIRVLREFDDHIKKTLDHDDDNEAVFATEGEFGGVDRMSFGANDR